jgi:hypothetical protein
MCSKPATPERSFGGARAGRIDHTAWCLGSLLTSSALFAVPAEADNPKIVAPSILRAHISTENAFEASVEGGQFLPPGTALIITRVPADITFSAGQETSPGVWEVPLPALNGLKMSVPAIKPTKSNLVLFLARKDKALTVYATANSLLSIEMGNAEEDRARNAKKKAEDGRRAEQDRMAEAQRLVALKRAEEERTLGAKETENTKVAQPLQLAELSNVAADALALSAAAQRLMKRGQEFLEQGNVLIARQYFLRASETGLAGAAFKLAETYDPDELKRQNAHTVVPDAATAKHWYTRALDLGALEANARLSRLGN